MSKKIHLKLFIFIAALLCLTSSANSQTNEKTTPQPSTKNEREYFLRLTPSIGSLTQKGSYEDPILGRLGIKKDLDSFDYVLLNLDLDVQLHRKWFATGAFIYSHAFFNAPVDGGVDVYGFPFGVKYMLLEASNYSACGPFLDHLQYWIGASAGPYVNSESITVNIGARNTHGSSVNAALGLDAQTGIDYFFNSNIGVGLQFKFQYLFFDPNIIIFSGGPSITGRF